jgi:hypothetical protein
MLKAVHRWWLKLRLRLVEGELLRSEEEMDQTDDPYYYHALKIWIPELQSARRSLHARIRYLSTPTERKAP